MRWAVGKRLVSTVPLPHLRWVAYAYPKWVRGSQDMGPLTEEEAKVLAKLLNATNDNGVHHDSE